MGNTKQELWYEDNRHSSILKDYIYLHEDNFVDWIDLAKSYHDAAQAIIRSFCRDPRDKIIPISVTGLL